MRNTHTAQSRTAQPQPEPQPAPSTGDITHLFWHHGADGRRVAQHGGTATMTVWADGTRWKASTRTRRFDDKVLPVATVYNTLASQMEAMTWCAREGRVPQPVQHHIVRASGLTLQRGGTTQRLRIR